MTSLRLPAGHAQDWLGRCDAADDATVVAHTERTLTLDLPDASLADLIADALYYAEEMGPVNTGDIDYRPKARTLLRALERLGVTYTRRPGTYTVTVTTRPTKEST